MKYLVLIPLVFVASCASRPHLALRRLPPSAVGPAETVRYGEVVRPYHVGRYVDPSHPETMQEQHEIYRVEVSGRWNLHPGSSTAAPVLNPPPDAALAPPLTNDVLVAEMNRQRDATALVMEQSARLAQSYSELQKIFVEMRNVARDNAALGARLAIAEQRLAGFEKELQKITGPPSLPTNDVSPFSMESTEPLKP
jgi:hypothetical protein